ncbi:MAG: DNA/RNA non-specific endonuclease [Alistipes sp.]|nr:DNA/RNA non-specific endonuclease [Alistipes sp.]
MRRRTKKLGSRRTTIYIIVLILLVAANYIHGLTEENAEPTATEQSTERQEVEKQVAKEAVPESSAKPIRTSKEPRSGWAELPAQKESRELYITHHMCDEQTRNYTVCYSARHRSPMWIAAPMHESYNGSVKRIDNYDYDPTLPVNIQTRLKRSYGEYTRGHMLGSAERNASREMNTQTFYVTNIAPQIQKGFNQQGGAWNNLEKFVDGQLCADTLYVVTGAIYDEYTTADGEVIKPRTTTNKNDGEQVGVPTAYYKALLRTKSGNSGKSVAECKASELKCAAFVVAHRSESGLKPSAENIMSVDELERLTGVDFFKGVPHAPEGKAVAKEWGL